MTELNIKRIAGAVVPLSLFVLAYVILTPPKWSDALRSTLNKEPGLVVIDDAMPYDPSDLKGIIWMPESAFRASTLKRLKRVLWLRPQGAQEAPLVGTTPTACKARFGAMLCVVDKAEKEPWRLSNHLKGVQAQTSQAQCTSSSNTSKCVYGVNDWEYLRREKHQFAGREHDCIWSHPVAGEPVVIRVLGLEAGQYLFSSGIDDSGMRGELPPVEVEIKAIKASESIRLSAGKDKGYAQTRLPLLTETSDLVLKVSSAKTGARFFCWDLSLKR